MTFNPLERAIKEGETVHFETYAVTTDFTDADDKIARDGYVFVRNLIAQADVEAVRSDILDVCHRHGLTATLDGNRILVSDNITIIEADTEQWQDFYRDIIKLPRLTALTLYDRAIQLAQAIYPGEDILPQSRIICRFFANHPSIYSTPPHRDFTWSGGTERTLTMWIPLVEVPFDLGGLWVLPGSHKQNFQLKGPDERAGFVIPPDVVWRSVDCYGPGDAIVFHGKTVHAAGGNNLPGHLRLSVEIHFQPLADPVRVDTMEPHWDAFGIGWDGIYASWPDGYDHLKYFWHKFNLTYMDDTPGTYKQDLRRRYLQNKLGAILAKQAREGN